MPRLALLFATFGYIGYFPIAPGTVGSAAGVMVWALLRWSGAGGVVAEVALALGLFVLGTWAASGAERALGGKDPGPVVVDEVMGQVVTLLMAPTTMAAAGVGFVLFRLFDVVKPWPADRFEQVAGGWGVMLDDLMAGVYACATLQAILWLAPGWLA